MSSLYETWAGVFIFKKYKAICMAIMFSKESYLFSVIVIYIFLTLIILCHAMIVFLSHQKLGINDYKQNICVKYDFLIANKYYRIELI